VLHFPACKSTQHVVILLKVCDLIVLNLVDFVYFCSGGTPSVPPASAAAAAAAARMGRDGRNGTGGVVSKTDAKGKQAQQPADAIAAGKKKHKLTHDNADREALHVERRDLPSMCRNGPHVYLWHNSCKWSGVYL
jgi:hypothetical protein